MTTIKELEFATLIAFMRDSEHKYCTAHSTLCFAIIKRIYGRVLIGHRFGAIKVCQTNSMVIDGNHRFLAYSLAGIQFEVIEGTRRK